MEQRSILSTIQTFNSYPVITSRHISYYIMTSLLIFSHLISECFSSTISLPSHCSWTHQSASPCTRIGHTSRQRERETATNNNTPLLRTTSTERDTSQKEHSPLKKFADNTQTERRYETILRNSHDSKSFPRS